MIINNFPSLLVPLVGLFLPAVTMLFLYFYIQNDEIL
ncbi:photosystem I reaction center subunit VIII [Enterobacter hormaechei]|uniref:Photosystem I reaction center subunit VIII n=7 Tax=Cupressaceae TaxID=3367 RepID=A0A0U2KXN6_9CONI|nr:photosystem I subunit VIII [Cupressus sempervirens]YP_009175412.1 photosystem I subunit VIII [Cupressus gigantea]YP_009370391.1 photosystem I subunit VIII [Cupressus chengiana]YP_009459357.1 photosystem I subunit VIII [Cupressus jiangeensis]YP_009520544.1 photosystem I subunit VIII [Cupressus tonkinensis]YP_009520626.1 photosystem I subunit VIII [Cupressus torulosa]YP_009917345.1 photosystem I subunit VIII [Callitropsis funebris]YP_010426707.1 photosystem I subunit VIII [Cupressus ducloux